MRINSGHYKSTPVTCRATPRECSKDKTQERVFTRWGQYETATRTTVLSKTSVSRTQKAQSNKRPNKQTSTITQAGRPEKGRTSMPPFNTITKLYNATPTISKPISTEASLTIGSAM